MTLTLETIYEKQTIKQKNFKTIRKGETPKSNSRKAEKFAEK